MEVTPLPASKATSSKKDVQPTKAALADQSLSNNAAKRLGASLDTDNVQSAVGTEDVRHGQQLSLASRRWMFALLLLIQIVVNFDSGAIAASLSELQAKYDMGHAQAGLIGSMAYIGLVAGTLFAAPLLSHYSNKRVLVTSLFFNCALATAFAPAPNSDLLLTLRFFIGLSQAVMVIYAPVWVDEFAPAERCTLWMAIVQGGVPMGIMIGYVTAGFMTANGVEVSVAFYVQAAAILPLAVTLACVPGRYLDTNQKTHFGLAQLDPDTSAGPESPDRLHTIAHEKVRHVLRALTRLLRNGVYVNMTLALCSLYFVVTGIQMWVTEYLTVYVGVSKNAVVSAFAATSATAPILGVLAGGLLLDKLGGYQGISGVHRACKSSLLLSFLCLACAVPAIFVGNFPAFIGLIWFLLFFGGAIMPAATGTIMSCVPRRTRSFACSLSTLMYHLFGYFAGPTVAGVAAEALGGTEWGIRIVLGWSLFGVIFLSAATICSHIRLAKATRHVLDQSEDYIMDTDVDKADSFEPSASFITPGAQLTAPERARHMNHGRYTRFDDPSTTTP